MILQEEAQLTNQTAREALSLWKNAISNNGYSNDYDFKHSINLYFNACLDQELTLFAEKVATELEPLVIENNLVQNLPRIDHYDGVGQRIESVIHHPSYLDAGDIIYGSRILERMSKPGGLLEALAFMFISSQAGEAGHNCPVACSAGIIRLLQKTPDFPEKQFYLKKLVTPSYRNNYTGAQFLTEIQGGSDVGQNATLAYQDEDKHWRIRGEKWFCSNADAELILITARYDPNITGTKGLGLFLVPAQLPSGLRNHYTLRRLKDKIGTRSMASAEIDFHDAYAIAVDKPTEGFKLVMENVLHLSRLFNTFCVLGMARRAYFVARTYAQNRVAFGTPIVHFPLVKENLARIKSENTALLASAFATAKLQDDFDKEAIESEEKKLLLRLLANLNKYLSALWTVEHIHHCLDVLAGNGAIESFSTIPRLLRDSIVCENWEGTHNVLRMQILRDIKKYHIDTIFTAYIQNQLTSINANKKYLETLNDAAKQLTMELSQLKSASDEIQSLKIKKIVDQMAILFCALHLLIEAVDQLKTDRTSKLDCFEYFTLLHLNLTSLDFSEAYLALIDRVIRQ